MKGKVLFVVGLGVGYVLGTRAGRRRYEQIKSVATRVWDSPAVQNQVHTVQGYAADRIGDLGTVVTEGVKRAVTRSGSSQSSGSGSSSAKTSAARTTKKTSAKTSSAKSSSGSSARKPPAGGSSSSSSKPGSSRGGSAGSDGQAS